MTVAESLALWPELRGLVDLRRAGWVFAPRWDRGGELVQLDGIRTWPDGSADAIRVVYTTDAGALRINRDGGLVWQREGTLADVVGGLLSLPAPGTPGAPCLVKGGLSWLWIPR